MTHLFCIKDEVIHWSYQKFPYCLDNIPLISFCAISPTGFHTFLVFLKWRATLPSLIPPLIGREVPGWDLVETVCVCVCGICHPFSKSSFRSWVHIFSEVEDVHSMWHSRYLTAHCPAVWLGWPRQTYRFSWKSDWKSKDIELIFLGGRSLNSLWCLPLRPGRLFLMQLVESSSAILIC